MKNFYGADLIEIPYFSSDSIPSLGIVCAGDVTDKQDQATKKYPMCQKCGGSSTIQVSKKRYYLNISYVQSNKRLICNVQET